MTRPSMPQFAATFSFDQTGGKNTKQMASLLCFGSINEKWMRTQLLSS